MLLPAGDLVALLKTVVDTPSVSGDEGALADAVETTLRAAQHLQVGRQGNTVWARTELGRASRVVIAGHLDTVPVAGNLPSRIVDGPDGQPMLWGRGTVDMKGGVAVMLHVATETPTPSRDVTWIFYDCEEVEAVRNGLGRLAASQPELLAGDLAVLMEPTNGLVEGGCQGSLRFTVATRGVAAHSARGWLGSNAIHAVAPVLTRIVEAQPTFGEVEVDGLTYREGLNATMISGGVASNVIPDRCVVQINYRFAPSVSADQAEAKMRALFDGSGDFEVLDVSAGARPGLDSPAAQGFVAAVGVEVGPKYGWTDVARFSALGVPALNFGPGDPSLAHRDDEAVALSQVRACAEALTRWLEA
ncbi:MAG: succinyl-diaminopimelate desuccinylase [Propionibacteriaceae bacterium]|nr:succinyl-diaminopimelate desuccinylase [Propionibacteriaceae bacterium]